MKFLLRRWIKTNDPEVWAEFKKDSINSGIEYRNWSQTEWAECPMDWDQIETWASNLNLTEAKFEFSIEVDLYPCDCGGEKSSGPGCHSHWCQSIQKRKGA